MAYEEFISVPSSTPSNKVPVSDGTGSYSWQDAPGGLLPKIIVTAPTGSTVTCTKDSTTMTGVEVSGTWTFEVKDFGTWTVNATLGSESASKQVVVDFVKEYTISLAYTTIYGVEWAGTSATTWSRTDAAANFSNPNPYYSGMSETPSSPFDNLYPWSGMVRATDSEAGELVKIPKFWFKWTGGGSGNTLKLQIADGPVDGFSVSPAHMDRGDGAGVRDYVYVGRYHCSSSNYKSVTGASPKVSITRSTARSSISALGSTIWQIDYATRLTIQMLYLVEFADWNSQTKIGYGCSTSSSIMTMGYTDNMEYHTGTTASSRESYGGTQYRYIEGLWDNVYDWLDGCYYNSSGMNVILNPSNFSDSSGGTSIGTPSSEYPTVMSLSSTSGYSWALYPTTAGGSNTTYVSDVWGFSSSYPCLFVGGVYFQSLDYGMFYVSYNSASYASGGIGARLLKLP